MYRFSSMMNSLGEEYWWKVVVYESFTYTVPRVGKGETINNKTKITWKGRLAGMLMRGNMKSFFEILCKMNNLV